MCTVCGLGISVCSAAPAGVADKNAHAMTASERRNWTVDIGMTWPP
jgi:hypothetical protein